MKILEINNQDGYFEVESVNKLINVNIVDQHPEMVLEDHSMLIFESADLYYKLAEDLSLFDAAFFIINLKKLMKDGTVLTDTVTDLSYNGQDVKSITKITIFGMNLYFIIRTGINPLAEEE